MNAAVYHTILYAWIMLSAITFVALLFIRAPYGKHIRKGFGPAMSNRLGWFIMELPACLLMLVYFYLSPDKSNAILIVFLIIWQLHYVQRSFIYPFRMRTSKKEIPFLIVGMAILFNVFNTYLNGAGIFLSGRSPDNQWLSDFRFIAGILLFLCGFLLNLHSDNLLRNLRNKTGTSYEIPRGGMFRWVSCPNYLGEIMEWTGWALLTWSLAGLSFALWTFANLVPRAIHNHKWYRGHFPDYPKDRKAVIPFIL